MMIRASDLPLKFRLTGTPEDKYEPLPEPPRELLYQGGHVGFFDLPTEVLVCKSQVVSPRQGRWWSVDLYLYCGVLIPHDVLVARPLYEGGRCYDHAYVVERWEDYGDDGHTDYRLVGYVLVVSDEDFKAAIDYSSHYR